MTVSILPTRHQQQDAARRAKRGNGIPPTHCMAPGCTRICNDTWIKDGCCSNACRGHLQAVTMAAMRGLTRWATRCESCHRPGTLRIHRGTKAAVCTECYDQPNVKRIELGRINEGDYRDPLSHQKGKA